MDPPEPPAPTSTAEWWSRPSVNDPSRRLYARIRPLSGSGRVLVEYFGDDPNAAPGFVQRYVSRQVAERILDGRGWTPFA